MLINKRKRSDNDKNIIVGDLVTIKDTLTQIKANISSPEEFKDIMECYIYEVKSIVKSKVLHNYNIVQNEDPLIEIISFTLVQTPKVLSKKIRLTIMKSDLKRYV